LAAAGWSDHGITAVGEAEKMNLRARHVDGDTILDVLERRVGRDRPRMAERVARRIVVVQRDAVVCDEVGALQARFGGTGSGAAVGVHDRDAFASSPLNAIQ
jgi:hypothetical protein